MHTKPALILSAPCKINLFLHITGQRSDGYHQLQTLFQLLDFADELSFTPASHLSLSSDDPAQIYQDNLILRAARLLQQEFSIQTGARIYLRKRIPMGAGLGGGSSNAATTLHGLNQLWQLGQSEAQLAALGLRLGADVPVFIHGRTAWAEGIGEQLSTLEHWPEPWYLILKPPVHVRTATIFHAHQLTRNTPTITLTTFQRMGGHNDCESVVCALYPEVANALAWLRSMGTAFLTGTGACVVQACSSAAQAHDRLSRAPCPGFVSRAKNRSALRTELHLNT